jgi:glycosyltransferase involved in cell wall biosynthesis
MKILFMNTFSAVHGGAERLVFDTSVELLERGHDVSIVFARDDRRSKNPEFWPSRVNRYYIPELVLPFTDRRDWQSFRHSEQYIGAKRYLQDILDIESPDLVHVHNFPCLEVLADVDVDVPIVRTIHSYEDLCENHRKQLPDGSVCAHALGTACRVHCGFEKSFKATRVRAENRFMKTRVSRLIAVSSYIREVLLANGFPKSKIRVLSNFTRLNFKPVDVLDENIVLYVGRLTPEKGLLELIDSLKLTNVPVKLLVVGRDGALGHSDFHKQVVRRASEAGIEIEIQGWLAGDDLRRAYARARVVAFSSIWPEPFGLVGIEAMTAGKPVIAFDGGGVRQWLDYERTGFIVPHGDIAGFAKCVDQLMSDELLRGLMGATARATAKARFSPDAHIRSLLGIYTEVLNESSADRSRGRTEICDAQCGIGVSV